MGILISEFFEIYKSYLDNKMVRLPKVTPYRTYIQWLEKQDKEALRNYWKKYLQFYHQFAGISILESHKPGATGYKCQESIFQLEPGQTRGLYQLAGKNHVTINTVIQTVWAIILGKYNSKSDVVFGVVVSGRPPGIEGVESMVGLFINTIPVRIGFQGETTFNRLLKKVQEKAIESEPYHYFYLAEIQSESPLKQNLFDHILVFENYPVAEQVDGALNRTRENKAILWETSKIEVFEQTNYDFNIAIHPGNQLKIRFNYNGNIYEEDLIKRIFHHFKQVFRQILSDDKIYVEGLTLLSAGDRTQLLYDFNDTKTNYPKNQTIHALFARQAEKIPDSIAVVEEGKVTAHQAFVTYRVLNRQANRLADILRKKGAEPGIICATITEPSQKMILKLLAVLKAGAAYLPLDPRYPKERIQYMLKDSHADILLIPGDRYGTFAEIKFENHLPDLLSEESWKEEDKHDHRQQIKELAAPGELAYVIYTSGSTGKPKGVMVEHRNVVRLVKGTNYIHFTPGDKLLVTGSMAFDISTFEVWGPLLNGLTLYLTQQRIILEADQLEKRLTKNNISLLHLIPQLFNQLVDLNPGIFKGLRCLLVGGDMVNPGYINKARKEYRGLEILHMYGPTENTTFSTFFPIKKVNDRSIPIGKPISNSSVYILDKHGKLQPIGVSGELCTGGDGVARGYLNNPELTAKKFHFVSSRYYRSYMSHMSYIYKTGDLARWLVDGNIEFLGRMDTQVKIRGFRIEPGEIEKALCGYEGIEECVVIPREVNGENRLLAYYKEKNKIKLWPSLAEYFIYDDIIYNAMVKDEARNEKYRNAIEKAAKGKILLEIGPGAEAILSRMCIEAGAKKVYAVEILTHAYEKARQTIKQLNLADKIILIHGDITKVELPEKVDGCVSEIVGTIGGAEGAAAIINSARKWVKDPSRMIPAKSITHIAALTLTADEFDYSFDELGAYYTKKIFNHYGNHFDLRLSLLSLTRKNIISNSDIFEELDFTRENPLEEEHEIHLEISHSSILNGFVVWLDLYCDEKEVIFTLEKKYIWLPIYFPIFSPGEAVREGDIIKAKVIRTLSANHLNPDFTLKGTLYKKHPDKTIPFTYEAPHQPLTFKSSHFYRQVFAADQLKVTREITSKDLRRFMEMKIPDYMIPTYFVKIENIPLSPHGKVDRKALPEHETGSGQEEYKGPRNEIEKKLVEIWQDLLGKTRVGIEDNFFAIGGDSIKSIQVAARMSKAGYSLEMRDILQNKTIAQLAPWVKKKVRQADQSLITGKVPLTPIQKQFLKDDLTGKRHFNQSLMLYREKGFDEVIVQKVFTAIVRHHDALRMVYEFNHEKHNRGDHPHPINALQYNRGIEGQLFDLKVFNFEIKDNTHIKRAIEKEANRLQAGIDLTKGPLVKLGLFKTTKGDHLLITVHHLVMDGVSGRILLEDFETGYRQMESGKEIKFQHKTDSFKYWSEQLYEYAAGKKGQGRKQLEKEFQYWQSVEAEAAKTNRLPCHHEIPEAKQRVKYIDTVTVNLDTQETRTLLEQTNQVYHTEINDILLTALGLAMQQWAGIEKALIELEGHGREPFIPGIDISRTIGWFTTQYPLILDMSQKKDLSYKIKSVKETLRLIPNKGTGYGILKHLTPGEKKKKVVFELKADISFNYLGEFGQEMSGGFAAFSRMSAGVSQNPGLKPAHSLVINGMIIEGTLRFTFSYNRYQYETGRIEHLADYFRYNLLRIIRHCQEKQNRELTPSDVGCPELSLEEFAAITGYINENIDENTAIEAIYPLSPMQNGILYHSLTAEDYDMYFVQTVLKLEGKIEKTRLEMSFNQLIRRYDIFRTIFIYNREDRPLQFVLKKRPIRVYDEDITRWQQHEQTLYLEEFKEKDRTKGFDLSKDILMRLSLFKTGPNNYHLIWSYHHILMDGWCFGIIYKELLQVYRQLKEKQVEPRELGLSPVTPYKYYIQWLEKQDRTAALLYWQKYLEGYQQQTGLSQWNKKEKPGQDIHGKYNLVIHENIISSIKKITAGNNVTINTLFQAIWGILLQRYNNCNDVVFGAVVSGRPAEIAGIEHMIGIFINTVPVRLTTHNDQSFSRLLKCLNEANISSRSYEYLSLAEIQAISPLKTNLIHHIMIFENYPLHEESKNIGTNTGQPGRTAVDFEVNDIQLDDHSHYDLDVIIIPGAPFITRFNYNPAAYDSDFIKKVGRHFMEILKQVKDNPGIIPEEIDFITPGEKEQILQEFNRTEANYPKDKTIHEILVQQVEQTPDHIALIGQIPNSKSQIPNKGASFGQILNAFGELSAHELHEEGTRGLAPLSDFMSITYRELNERVNQLADLLKEKGVQPDTIVAIMVERSVDMIIGIFGILKAGGAYLPIDPEYPMQRIQLMLTDSSTKFLVTTPDLTGRFGKLLIVKCQLVMVNEKPPGHLRFNIPPKEANNNIQLKAANLAYLIYTSGSSGKPKGVMINHQSLVNFITGITNIIHFTGHDRILSLTTICFDIFGLETLLPLTRGSQVVIGVREEQLSAEACALAIKEKDVTILQLTPSRLSLFLSVDHFSRVLKRLRCLLVGGEALPGQLLEKTRNAAAGKIYNMYGPTETTIWSAVKDVSKGEDLNIGTPIANTQIYILGLGKTLQPVGIPGELCIGGVGLARGYLNKPGLTAEKFVEQVTGAYRRNRCSYINKKFLRGSRGRFLQKKPPGRRRQKIYRTGDQARWLWDGNIEFLGRVDHQVKIRGFRIELEEIESILLEHEDIKEAALTIKEIGRGNPGEKERGEQYLCAYVVSHRELTILELREYLSEKLPHYMVPSYFIQLKAIPLTPNGKVDRNALPGIDEIMDKGVEYHPPTNEIQEILVEIWQKVLEIEQIGIDDGYLALGGDSIKAIQIAVRLQNFQLELDIKDIFEYPTIRKLSSYIKNSKKISPKETQLTSNNLSSSDFKEEEVNAIFEELEEIFND